MSDQYNKVLKRRRRQGYLKRLKERRKNPKSSKATKTPASGSN